MAKNLLDDNMFFRRHIIHSYEQQISSFDKEFSAFLYWEVEEGTIGILVFSSSVCVFERKLSKEDRIRFLGNPAASLLEAKDGFKNKMFKIEEFDDDSINLAYLNQSIQISCVKDKKEVSRCQRELFRIYKKEINELSVIVDTIKEKTSPKKAAPHRPMPSQSAFGRRQRPNTSYGPSASKIPKKEASDDNE